MKKLFKITFITSLLFLIAGICVFAIFFSEVYGVNNVVFDKNILLNQTAKISLFDVNSSLIETASSSNPVISLDELPKYVPQAFISIEDKNFYNHSGLNYKRMLKAIYTNLTKGYAKEGASTISQQLIKNTYLTSEKTFSRKLNEIILTKKLEQAFSKDDILESYLNIIYFGNSSYGIESASENYFNKSAKDLSLGESATLAGLIKSPRTYSPIYNIEASFNRRNIVLNEMKNDGYITTEQYESAISEPITISENEKDFYKRRIYEKAAIDEVAHLLKLSEQDVATSNLKVYTYMDKNLQNEVENLTLNKNYYHENEYGNIADSGVIVIDNETGGIKAFYGKTNYNLASMKRSPGSAIKPILVYAPALEYGKISPTTPILDEEMDFHGYSPHNVSDKYYGWITARNSIEKSLNIPAIKILQYVGIDRAKNFCEKTGIQFDESDTGYTIALGGLTNGVNFISLINSYVPFSNGGNFINANFIKKIESENGKLLYENKEVKQKIMKEETAYLMTDMLISSVKNGTSKKLNTLTFEVAGKTGTVGLHSSNSNTDAWSIGYTKNNTVGVWFGNSTGEKEMHLDSSNNGGTYASMLARDILNKAETQKTQFKVPNNIVYCNIDAMSLENDHSVKLASKDLPEMYKLKEIFSKEYAPNEISTYFNTLKKPHLTLTTEINRNILSFDANKYYTYELYKLEEDKTTLLSEITGKNGKVEVEDDNIENDILYEYYVIAKQINFDSEIEKSVESNSVKAIKTDKAEKMEQKKKKKISILPFFF